MEQSVTGSLCRKDERDGWPQALAGDRQENCQPSGRGDWNRSRDNPTWEPLFPFLEQLGIETVITEDLLHWDAKAEELMEWMRKRWSPQPELRTEIHEKLGVFDTLGDLRGLAYEFLFFEQPKHE